MLSPLGNDEKDLTKLKVDSVSEARFHRELRQQLKEALSASVDDVDLDYLLGDDLLPPVISSIVELLKRVEEEVDRQDVHKTQVLNTPALAPRTPMNPLHFLASHLMRHHPKHTQAPPPLQMSEEGFSKDEMNEIKDTFRLVTKDNETMTRNDLRTVLRGRGKSMSLAGVRLMLSDLGLDPDGKGTIFFAEYVQVIRFVGHGTKPNPVRQQSQLIKDEFQLTGAQYKYLQRQFSLYDIDGNDGVSIDEIKKVFQKMPQINISDAEIDSLFERIDTDGSNSINFREFVESHVRQMERTAATKADLDSGSAAKKEDFLSEFRNLKHSFDIFDVNGDGHVSRDELNTVLLGVDVVASPDELDMIMQQSDPDGNGTIEFTEFVKAMEALKRSKDL